MITAKYKDLEFIKGAFLFLFSLWFLFNFFSLILAITDGSLGNRRKCLEKPRNVEKFLPAYRLGCWLRGYQGEKTYYESKNF